MMDHFIVEKLTKIIKTAKWGKSHQKKLEKSSSLVSILPSFYEEHLLEKIQKAQNDTNDLTVFLCFWDLDV